MRVIEKFVVVDRDGGRHVATQYARPSGRQVIGGGSAPDTPYFALDDGTELQPAVGAQQFVDRRTGRVFERA